MIMTLSLKGDIRRVGERYLGEGRSDSELFDMNLDSERIGVRPYGDIRRLASDIRAPCVLLPLFNSRESWSGLFCI